MRFVLVEPQSPGNAGAAARALKNLGFGKLVLVRPHFAVDHREAQSLAVSARDVLAQARICESLDQALQGAQVVVGTTRRTGKQRQPHWRLDTLVPELARLSTENEVAVVFGREDHGLSDVELDRCTHLAYLPASASYGSFNLAQAILLVAYELRRLQLPASDASQEVTTPLADDASREAMYGHLEQAMRSIGYIYDVSAEPILRQFRRLFGRAELTTQEVQLLRGLARQILWAAKQANLVDHNGQDGCAPEKR